MSEWWKKYFNSDSIEEVRSLLQKNGKDNPDLHEQIFEKAALCRLSFASLKLDIQEPMGGFQVCSESIISQTNYGMKKSRPLSAKWAFWLSYFLRRELEIGGKPPTSAFLSDLIAILLTRSVPGKEVITKLSQLRRDAEEHAMQAARVFLVSNLLGNLDDVRFEADLRNHVEKSFSESSQFGWFIVNGKIPEEHLKDIIKMRRKILLNIGIYGLLIGKEPIVMVDQRSKTIHGIPIPVGGGFVFNSPIPKGTIHLEKANDIPFPEPFLQRTAQPMPQASLRIDKDAQGLTTISLKFPIEALTSDEPCASAILAVPVWWATWQAYMPLPLNLISS